MATFATLVVQSTVAFPATSPVGAPPATAAFAIPPDFPQRRRAGVEGSLTVPFVGFSVWRPSQASHRPVLVLGVTAALLALTYMVLRCFKSIEQDSGRAAVSRRLAGKVNDDDEKCGVRTAALAPQVVGAAPLVSIFPKRL